MLPAPSHGHPTEGHRILAYLTDEDCAALPGGEPSAVLARVVPMAADGHLMCRAGAAPMTGARPMRPAVFLGRTTDGKLAYLCQPVSLTNA
jgi:hypothetical protein